MQCQSTDLWPSRKTFILEEEQNLLLDLVGHVISMACHDDAFDAQSMRDISQIYRIQIPSHKKSMTLKWKSEKLDLPLFRQPIRSLNGYRTSPTEPLRAATWNRYLRRLGLKTGLEHALTQYVIRRANCNAINGGIP